MYPDQIIEKSYEYNETKNAQKEDSNVVNIYKGVIEQAITKKGQNAQSKYNLKFIVSKDHISPFFCKVRLGLSLILERHD